MPMRVNGCDLTVTVNGATAHAETTTGVLDEVSRAVSAGGNASAAVTLPSRDGAFTRRVYRVLGVTAPVPARRLSVFSDGSLVLVTYEDDDHEWVIEGAPRPGTVQLRTRRGEPFAVPASDCTSPEQALDAVREFLATGKRPSGRWRRS